MITTLELVRNGEKHTMTYSFDEANKNYAEATTPDDKAVWKELREQALFEENTSLRTQLSQRDELILRQRQENSKLVRELREATGGIYV